MQIHSVSKYADLIAEIVALISAVVIFIFFMNINVDPASSNKVSIMVKSGYSSWAWGIYSISSMLYYFVRSKGKTISGGYMNPLFRLVLEGMTIIPIVGLALSLVRGTRFILESQTWNTIIIASSQFLDSMLILFVFVLFSVGLRSIKRFF